MRPMARLASGGGIAIGLLMASIAAAMESSTTAVEAVGTVAPPSTVVEGAGPVDSALDRGRCEFQRARAAESFGQIGLLLGLIGGSAAGAELSRDQDGGYNATGSLVGMAVGGLGGWLLGRGVGRVTHPCASVEWTGRSQAEWARYEAERKAFDKCIKRKGNAVMIGLLVGSLVGGGVGYAISRENAAPLVYGVAIGELLGIFLGDYWSADCRTPMAMRYSGIPLELPPEVRP